MSAVAAHPEVVDYDPLLNKSYEGTALGPDVVAWLDWLELGGAAERTIDTYERDLSVLCHLYPTKGLQDLTDLELGAAVKRFSRPQRRVRKASYDSFYKWARKTRRIKENPMELLPTIKSTPQRFIDVFSNAEVDDLLSLPADDAVLMCVLVDAGLRKGEARYLQVRRIRLPALSETEVVRSESISDPDSVIPASVSESAVLSEAGSLGAPALGSSGGDVRAAARPASESTGDLVVIRGKGGKDRVIPLTARLSEHLRWLLLLERLSPQDYLWYTRPGGGRIQRSRAIGEGSFDRWWRRCLDTAGVRYRNPHVARHTFATRWLKRGGALAPLSRAMGHASISTTFDLYGHLDTTDIAAAMALMEAR